MAKYLDPKADVTFKKVFGEHKNLLISFLNALLPLEEGKMVESIEYMPPELVPDTPDRKNSIVDVRCMETGGRQFIVEMQLSWTTEFKQRVLFNAAKAYVRQLGKSRRYMFLQPVYSLNLVNAVFEPDMEGCYHHYRMVHYLDSQKVIDGLQLVFVELPKFTPHSFSEKKATALWLRYLTEINEQTAAAPRELLDDPDVSEALRIVEESAYSDAEMEAYDRFWDAVRREASFVGALDDAKAELAETRALIAEETARANAETARANAETARANAETARANAAEAQLLHVKLDTARKMKAKGFPADDISELTGLTAEQIASL